MTTEDCVDAALRALCGGEKITAPSVQDDALLKHFEAASSSLLAATQSGQPAARYNVAH